jgi:Sulfatase
VTSNLDSDAAVARQGSRVRAVQLAVLACFGGVFAEWLAVAFGVQQLANIWELQWGTLWLLPTALAVAAAVGVAWGLWWRAWLESGAHSFEARLAHGALLLGVAAGAYGISFGRHFEVPWRRALFIAVAALAVHLALPTLRQWLRAAQAKAPFLLALAAFACAVGLEIVNRWVLVRLYPVFHLGLALLSLGSLVYAVLVAFGAPRSQPVAAPHRLTLRIWGLLGVLCLGMIPWTSQRLARFDNFRWSLLENAPLLGRAVVLAGLVSPPVEPAPPTDSAGSEAQPTVPSAQLEGRDVLLITVDALRADHVGSYGYTRPTTPNIDALASTGIRFNYAYCATPHTSYSLTSLMTGKYIRPLLLQGAGRDSDTWASLLRTYEYRTAAFYPPAVFFIDGDKFASFEQTGLGFEYEKKEFLEGEARVEQVRAYLSSQDAGQRLFVWVHLFGPHEPYESHPAAPFGDQDIDRYDSEIHAADETVGQLVRLFRQARPESVAIVTADHGEEFGDHGGRYHGTSVYEEQVRVPLVVNIGGSTTANIVAEPVQTIDLLPTVLSALNIPIRPRIRGRDLSAHLFPSPAGAPPPSLEAGLAYAETDEQTLLAQGPHRLICLRRVGACKLFDVSTDPKQLHDQSAQQPALLEQLRGRLQAINAGHGQFENQGLRAEGKHWPTALLRGLAGDGDAAVEIGDLLEDADVQVRREAARVLMVLRRNEPAAALRLAVQRDEDPTVRRYAAIALTRLGEGAPLTLELLQDNSVEFRRLAALALAEGGDDRGEAELVAWWSDPATRDYAASRDLLQAFGKIRCKAAVRGLIGSLDDVRLRPEIAATLAQIGDEAAVGALVHKLREEPYQTARVALSHALVELGASQELVVPLRRWLGVPDPLKDGVQLAMKAGIAEHLGGPSDEDLKRIRKHSDIGEVARIIIPKTGNGQGLRLLVRVRNRGAAPAAVRVATPLRLAVQAADGKRTRSARVPELDPARQVRLDVPVGADAQELWVPVPEVFGWYPGLSTHVFVYAPAGVDVEGLLVLPLQDEVRAPQAAHPAVMPGKADPPTTPGNPDANR